MEIITNVFDFVQNHIIGTLSAVVTVGVSYYALLEKRRGNRLKDVDADRQILDALDAMKERIANLQMQILERGQKIDNLVEENRILKNKNKQIQSEIAEIKQALADCEQKK